MAESSDCTTEQLCLVPSRRGTARAKRSFDLKDVVTVVSEGFLDLDRHFQAWRLVTGFNLAVMAAADSKCISKLLLRESVLLSDSL